MTWDEQFKKAMDRVREVLHKSGGNYQAVHQVLNAMAEWPGIDRRAVIQQAADWIEEERRRLHDYEHRKEEMRAAEQYHEQQAEQEREDMGRAWDYWREEWEGDPSYRA